MGRPPIGKTAMTDAERMRRYRLKHGTAKPVTKLADPDHAMLVKELAAAKVTIQAQAASTARSIATPALNCCTSERHSSAALHSMS